MREFTFNLTKRLRAEVLSLGFHKDSLFFEGKGNVLISVPHGVSQTRLGKHKVAEIGTIPMGKLIAKETDAHLLVKTTNNFDDANFDENCAYRKRLKEIIKKHDIKYLLDIHGLAKWRDVDINLGTNLGQSIKQNEKLFDKFYRGVLKNFKVSVDQPFMASASTISGAFSKEFNIWSVQVEVNCGITNYPGEIERFNILAGNIIDFIKQI